jgi:hypothetical protein
MDKTIEENSAVPNGKLIIIGGAENKTDVALDNTSEPGHFNYYNRRAGSC